MRPVYMKQSLIIVCNNLAFHTSSAEPAARDMRKDEYEFHIRALIPTSALYRHSHKWLIFESHSDGYIFIYNTRNQLRNITKKYVGMLNFF